MAVYVRSNTVVVNVVEKPRVEIPAWIILLGLGALVLAVVRRGE